LDGGFGRPRRLPRPRRLAGGTLGAIAVGVVFVRFVLVVVALFRAFAAVFLFPVFTRGGRALRGGHGLRLLWNTGLHLGLGRRSRARRRLCRLPVFVRLVVGRRAGHGFGGIVH